MEFEIEVFLIMLWLTIEGRTRSDLQQSIVMMPRVPSVHPEQIAKGNVAPTDPLPVVGYDSKEHQRSLDVTRRGLNPHWAKDIKIGYSTFNARAKEIDTKPASARGVSAAALPQAALCARARGWSHHCDGGPVGDLALARLSGRISARGSV